MPCSTEMMLLSRGRVSRTGVFALGAGGLLALSMALCTLISGCGRSSQPADLSIFFTCDTQGRLEPCGCFVGQFGGLTRLKTALDKLAPPDALLLDVGDSIGGTEDYDIIQYGYMLKAFQNMKFDAINMGHREARLSAAQLREMSSTSPLPMISANLMERATGKRILEPYKVVRRGGKRIALVGLTDAPADKTALGDGLEVGNMEATLSALVPELREKADILILLAFTDEASLVRLANQFYEFDLILGGRVSQPAQDLKHENRSVIYYVTNQARAFGYLRMKAGGDSQPEVSENEIRFLHDRIPQDESFRGLVQTYRDEIRHTRLEVDNEMNAAENMVPGVRTAATYVGSEQCTGCHSSAAAVWKKSEHSHAFSTLVERKADADPKCIGCHATGYESFSGYRREFGATKLVNVGCESCHGPGSLHIRSHSDDTTVTFTYRKLGAGDCQKCHYGEFSRPFKWAEFWPLIRH